VDVRTVEMRAEALPSWPTRRGFCDSYEPYGTYDIGTSKSDYGFQYGGGLQVAARRAGTVAFATHWQPATAQALGAPSNGGHLHPSAYGSEATWLGQVHAFDADAGGAVRLLTDFSPSEGSTTPRAIQLVEVASDGRVFAFLRNGSAASVADRTQEHVHAVVEVGGAPRTFLLDGPGRASTTLCLSPSGDRLYYAFSASPSDESQKRLVDQPLVPGPGGTLPAPRRLGTPARYEVLHAGR
jgi:hypothetical protein